MATATEKDRDNSASSPSNQRPVSPNDLQNVGASESDVELSLYRHGHGQSAERSSSSKSRRSQSLDDVRDDDMTSNAVITGSDNVYGDDISINGNGDDGENFAAGSDEAEARRGSSADDQQSCGVSDDGSQGVRIIPVVRAESFKEAMRSSQMDVQQPDYSRTISQPPPATTAADLRRDSRSSWVMPVFPSLEEVFNEWFTSAMSRTGSFGSSSSTPRVRTQSGTSTSSGRGVQMRRPSGNSPLHTPEFHNKRLTTLFDFEPTPLGPILDSSDNPNSSEMADDWMNSRTGFSAKSRLPPGFETGPFDREFGFRPSLFRMSQSFSDPHFSRPLFNSATHSVPVNSSADVGKVIKTHSEQRQSQTGSTSRIIPVKVITTQSSSDGEAAKDASRSSTAGSKIAGGRHIVKSNTVSSAEDKYNSAPVSDHETSSLKHSSQFMQPHGHLPAGFLTGFGGVSVPVVSDTTSRSSKVDGRTGINSRNVKVVSVSEADDERNVRVIPVTREQNTETSEAPTRRQRSPRSRVIPVMIQSSAFTPEGSGANANGGARMSTNPASEAAPFMIPVTVVQSDGGTASNTLTAGPSDRQYLPLCYDDEEGEAVKKILQEMTIKRLPVRDTVRLLNMKKSRSMDFDDAKQNAVREESPSGGDHNASARSPTADLLPAGFFVGTSSWTAPRDSSAERLQAASAAVTGDLIRKRLHQFDGGDANL